MDCMMVSTKTQGNHKEDKDILDILYGLRSQAPSPAVST